MNYWARSVAPFFIGFVDIRPENAVMGIQLSFSESLPVRAPRRCQLPAKSKCCDHKDRDCPSATGERSLQPALGRCPRNAV